MFFVLMVHSLYKGILNIYSHPFNEESLIYLIVEAIAIVGVNCFILISGYFGIRLRAKAIVSFVFQIYFFAFIALLVTVIIGSFDLQETGLTSHLVIKYLFPVSHWVWFIPCYILLMLASPVLNSWLDCSSLKKVCLLTFTVYALTYFWDVAWNESHGFSGYEIGFFFILYVCGNIIRRLHDSGRLPTSRFALMGYFTCVILLVVIGIIQYRIPFFRSLIWVYNCPIVLLESVLLFVFFAQLKLQHNKVINFIGRSCFAVLLLHISPNYSLSQSLHIIDSVMVMGGYKVILIFCTLILYYFVAIAFDQIRIFCWNKLSRIKLFYRLFSE